MKDAHEGFNYKGFRWEPIECSDLDKVTADLTDPTFVQAALRKYPQWNLRQLMQYRLDASVSGSRLHLNIYDGDRVCGWVGLLPAASYPDYIETSIFLHPDYWGTGLSSIGYEVLWAVGGIIMDFPYIVASIDIDNIRSVKGHQKLFPDAEVERVYEKSKDRTSVNVKINTSPGDIIEGKDLAEIERVLQDLAFYKALAAGSRN